MNKHTLGLWFVYGDNTVCAATITSGMGVTGLPVAVYNKTHIAKVHGSSSDDANALLIAAAPDLLKACQSVMKTYAKFIAENPTVVDESPCVGMCRAAIAKATGDKKAQL
jgi:hypothetical protein